MIVEVYEVLKAAGVPEEEATRAAEALSESQLLYFLPGDHCGHPEKSPTAYLKEA